jgi:hypothetical protein
MAWKQPRNAKKSIVAVSTRTTRNELLRTIWTKSSEGVELTCSGVRFEILCGAFLLPGHGPRGDPMFDMFSDSKSKPGSGSSSGGANGASASGAASASASAAAPAPSPSKPSAPSHTAILQVLAGSGRDGFSDGRGERAQFKCPRGVCYHPTTHSIIIAGTHVASSPSSRPLTNTYCCNRCKSFINL